MPVALASAPSFPCRGFLTIVSAILSPFGSEHASTTERGRLAAVAARMARQLGASCGPSTAMPSLSALTAKTRRPSGLTARPRGSSSARAPRQSSEACATQAAAGAGRRSEGAGRRIELQRHDRVGAGGRHPDDARVGPEGEPRGPCTSAESTQPGVGRIAGDAGDAREARRSRGRGRNVGTASLSVPAASDGVPSGETATAEARASPPIGVQSV